MLSHHSQSCHWTGNNFQSRGQIHGNGPATEVKVRSAFFTGTIFLWLALTNLRLAGPIEDGLEAYRQNKYPTVRLLKCHSSPGCLLNLVKHILRMRPPGAASG